MLETAKKPESKLLGYSKFLGWANTKKGCRTILVRQPLAFFLVASLRFSRDTAVDLSKFTDAP